VARGIPIASRAQFNARGLDHGDIGSRGFRTLQLELRSIAEALGADLSESLYLEKNATVENVKKIDLSRFRSTSDLEDGRCFALRLIDGPTENRRRLGK
jgi:hypothetical protein